MLFSQLVYWMLDINYGDLYYIGESLFSRTKIGYDAVESLYNQIMFGMYYSILSSFTNNLDADALRRMIDKLLRLNTNSHLIFK